MALITFCMVSMLITFFVWHHWHIFHDTNTLHGIKDILLGSNDMHGKLTYFAWYCHIYIISIVKIIYCAHH